VTETQALPSNASPSMGALLKATALALALAIVVLATAVLPAEYGLDPLGTGRMTGLLNLSSGNAPPATIVAAAGGPIASQATGYKVDAIDLTLRPKGEVEYKYHLNKGAAMVYSWTASGVVGFDMHTEPDGKGPSASDSFEAGEARAKYGTYTAPYAGIHGWYWQNRTDKVVTIQLKTAGFYSVAKMFDGSGQATDFDVQDPPAPAFP
jgi:hypothetical protein